MLTESEVNVKSKNMVHFSGKLEKIVVVRDMAPAMHGKS